MYRCTWMIILALAVTACDNAIVGDELCGNGTLDSGELCDVGILSGQGACPSAGDCDDGASCTIDSLTGSACLSRCEHTAITQPADGDGCCPDGASFETDDDCPAGCGDEICGDDETCLDCPSDCGACCGNGQLDNGETCDTAIEQGLGHCVEAADCQDGLPCTLDALEGTDCTVRCGHTAITLAADDDSCCPPGASRETDNDCPVLCGDDFCGDDESCLTCPTDCGVCCGNGELDLGEACDTAIVQGSGQCPEAQDCDDGFVCTIDQLVGSDCDQECQHEAIADLLDNDGCCPPGAIHFQDNDCAIVCGDEECEGDEDCENCPIDCGSCPPVCPADAMVPDGSTAGPGQTCEAAGTLTCAGHAQAGVLTCAVETCTWINTDACIGGLLCDSTDALCRPPVTACIGHMPGDIVCDGPDRHVCGADLVTSQVSDCGTVQLCQLGQGAQCAVCLAGQHRCVGADLQVCAADHLSWDQLETCNSEALCNAGAGECTDQVCVAGQARCVGDELEVCNAQGSSFDSVQTCAAGMCDELAGQCDLCSPLAAICEDTDTRAECSADGQSWQSSDCPAEQSFCIDGGLCVACQQDSDCPATGDSCQLPACNANVCGTRTIDLGETCAPGAVCNDQAQCVCTYVYEDCNNDMDDGCEIDIYSDGENCAVCGRSCQGGQCDTGFCQPVLLAGNTRLNPVITLDDNYIYFGDGQSWSILQLSKQGGDPFTIADIGGGLADIKVDYSNVYWMNLNEVYKAPKSGGSRTYMAPADGGQLALSDSDVYYTVIFDGEIRMVGKFSGGSPWTAVSGQPDFDVDGNLFSGLTVAEDKLYWSIDGNTTANFGGLRNSSLYGESLADVATGARIGTMTSDESGVYWVDSGVGVYAYTFADHQVHVLSEGANEYTYISWHQMAVDDEYVYYSAYYHNTIYKVSKAGGTPFAVVYNLDNPSGLAVDDDCLYFTDGEGLKKVVLLK